MKRRVLIVCTSNSCRSQMAAGLWRSLTGADWEITSAGSEPTGFVNPLAIRAMAEFGIDISKHQCKHIDNVAAQAFDLVVTVCNTAKERCPVLPGEGTRLHWPFPDPAETSGGDAQKLAGFRIVRDLIKRRIQEFIALGH